MDTTTRQAKRAPVTLKIKFKSATLDQFIERYAVDVSPGGIFIRTKEPLAVGTQMRFEFQLRDATPLITGEGTVVWTRENDPTRPAAAPGMGVRFDRLGDGSQTVLDKILAEKAKQPAAPTPGGDSSPKGFLEAPTKVAPSPLVGALASETKPKLGALAPSRGGFADERTDNTPLPRPMPFHSDAEEFPEEAFEEATKVRSLDALAATTAKDTSDVAEPMRKATAAASEKMAAAGEKLSSIADRSPLPAPPPSERGAAEKPASAPAPAQPAAVAPPIAASAPVAADRPAAATLIAAAAPPARAEAPRLVPATEKPAVTKPIVAAEKAATATAVSTQSMVQPPSKAPTAVIVGLLLAAVVVAAVWFVFLRKQETTDNGVGTGTVATGSVDPGSASATAGASGVATGSMVATGSDVATGGGAIGTGGGALPAEIDAGAAPMVETGTVEIKASVPGATVEVAGGASGPAPYTATLEKGKPHKITVRADQHKPVEIEVTVGDRVPVVKLEPMARVVRVTSKPAGAAIYVDGAPTGKKTPADITLTKAQLAKANVKISLRRAGFAAFNDNVAKGEFVAEGDGLAASVDATLVAVRGGGGGGGGGDGSASGSGSGSGTSAGSGATSGSGSGSAVGSGSGSSVGSGSGATSGSAGAGSGSGATSGSAGAGSGSGAATGSGKATGSGAGTGSASGAGSSSGSGSSEPTPDWMK